MAQPAFLNGGTTPHRADTRWFRWVRILGEYQNQPGADPSNNPSRLDTIWWLKYKVLRALGLAAAPTAMLIAGGGLAGANGTITRNGSFNGRPYYGDTAAQSGVAAASGQGTAILWNGSGWRIYSIIGPFYTIVYSSDEDVATPDLVTVWDALSSPPAPTVTIV